MTAPFVQAIAIQTRNVAGLVTKRRTNTTGAMPFVESNWTYDKLGRVASQVVQKGPGPTQVLRQDLTYFGNDDPKTLTHYLGTVLKQFQYGYDLRHQITRATTTTAGYFTANYTYGLGGRFTRATEAQTIAPLPAGTEVKPRDVNYIYGGTDPEQVTALTNVGNGQTYAGYTYDAAGNQITRTYPSTNESWDYLYDGKDQLRRATRKRNGVVQGSEEYWYDNDGQRIAVVKRNAAGAKTEMIWFIGDTQAHYNAAGSITHVYSHLSLGTPVARVDRTSNATTAVEYQFHGLASNTIAAVDQGGTVNASFSYAPFGEVVEATEEGAATAGTAAHRRRLNDKYEDDLTALAYYGARFYDKTLIGWTQADPLYIRLPDAAQLSSPRRASIYAFSLNNSLRYMDPDGLDVAGKPLWTASKHEQGASFEHKMRKHSGGPVQGGTTLGTPGEAPMNCGTSPPGVCDPSWTPSFPMDPRVIESRAEFRGGLNDPIGVTARDEWCLKNRGSCTPSGTQVIVVGGALAGGAGLWAIIGRLLGSTVVATAVDTTALQATAAVPIAASSPAGRSVAQAIEAGLVGSGGRLAQVLSGIEQGFAAAGPRNALQALNVVGRAAQSAGLEAGIGSSTIGGSFVLQNVGGVVTTIAPSGAITVTRGADILLQLFPK